ncbi:ABC transporter ATP-binding protein [Candidatus Hamiltonella endosymbiont of Tuberolachnus salignus]|uniref:ABC transporter ATP-binding protein n=1 Tax=Candidatus Williamhamiltonella endosymbiont of Tuberolachnus salignus TaxID=3077954 RepID=UPI0030CD387D
MVKLRLEEVGVAYGTHQVLSKINTSFFLGGQVVAVVGPNASGKSSLFKRMAGIIEGEGKVHLTGNKKGHFGVCYMPQEAVINARLTVYESLLLVRKQFTPSWRVHNDELILIDSLMSSLSINGLAFRYLTELSGGQRQLVSIAQILARDPEILLMDEPTSALDMYHQLQVLNFIRSLAQQKNIIVFIALHDLNHALRFSDQMIVVANGGVKASGPSEEVLTTEMLWEIYGINARIENCSRQQAHVIVDGFNQSLMPV